MATSAGSGFGLGTLAAGAAVVAVVGVVGYLVVFSPGPEPEPSDSPQGAVSDVAVPPVVTGQGADMAATGSSPATVAADTVAEDTVADEPVADDPQAAPDVIAPRFDLVRIDAAGGALIAGQAESNAELRLRLDGSEILLATSDAGGDFVAMFDIPPSELPRVLSLEMLMEDGSVLVSEQSVIISPTLRAPATEPGSETEAAVAVADAGGPDVPGDSGVTELALAIDTDTPPVTAATPIAPAAPDMPAASGAEAGAPNTAAPVLSDSPTLTTTPPDASPVVTGPETTTTRDVVLAEDDGVAVGATTGGNDAPDRGLSVSSDATSPDQVLSDTADSGAVVITDQQVADAPNAESAAEEVAGGAAPSESGDQDTGEEETGANGAIADAAPDGSSAEPDVDILAAADMTQDAPESASAGATVPSDVTELAMAETDAASAAPSPTAEGTVAADTTAPARPEGTTPDQAPSAEIAETGAGESVTPPSSDQSAPALEPQAPTVLLADSQGIRVIQSGGEGPQVQSRVTLDSIAYDTVGDVLLAGRGPAESDVRFYLDNQPVHLAPIDPQGGWSTELPQIDPGTYTLRLDQVSADGAVQSRIETPFLREEPETVAEITARTGENVITVQWGNTLWGIAQQHLGEGVAYVQIYEANRDQIRDPDLIYPGQIFTIPE